MKVSAPAESGRKVSTRFTSVMPAELKPARTEWSTSANAVPRTSRKVTASTARLAGGKPSITERTAATEDSARNPAEITGSTVASATPRASSSQPPGRCRTLAQARPR